MIIVKKETIMKRMHRDRMSLLRLEGTGETCLAIKTVQMERMLPVTTHTKHRINCPARS
jgi:hypothetical protein